MRKYLETYREQQALQQENNLCPRGCQLAQLPIPAQVYGMLAQLLIQAQVYSILAQLPIPAQVYGISSYHACTNRAHTVCIVLYVLYVSDDDLITNYLQSKLD